MVPDSRNGCPHCRRKEVAVNNLGGNDAENKSNEGEKQRQLFALTSKPEDELTTRSDELEKSVTQTI